LQVLGGGDDLVRELQVRARVEGAESNIEWIKYVKDREHLPEFYRQADVFASPADHEVGVANVYVEAMACGCPVIASKTGGAPEAVIDGETGILVPPRSVEATTIALDCILGDATLRRRMAHAARRRAEQYFARERYITRVLTAYHKTIDRAREKLEWLKRTAS
jgi:glycosyltransferase involved in cell wall biosynthesis